MCKGCALGNNSKATFSGNESRSKGILDIIHSNVSGWMLFMNTKDEVFNRL
jgi:hypothetical protein